MMAEIIKDLTAIKNTSEVTTKHVLSRAKKIEAQRFQKTMLGNLKDNKEFDMIMKQNAKQGQTNTLQKDRQPPKKENPTL